jgi:hypothetical protein
MRVFLYDACDRIEVEARRALARVAEGDTLRTQLAVLRRFLRRTPPDTIALRRRVADRALELLRCPFARRVNNRVKPLTSGSHVAGTKQWGKTWPFQVCSFGVE